MSETSGAENSMLGELTAATVAAEASPAPPSTTDALETKVGDRLRRALYTFLCLWLPVSLAVLCCGIFTCGYGAEAILRHDTLQSNALDLGYEDQALWNTLLGQPFAFTLLHGGGFSLEYQTSLASAGTSLLGYHAELLLAALAPLYIFWPDVRVLLFFQALVVCSGSLLLYALAVLRLGNRWAACLLSVAYLCSPFVEALVLSDFHTVALASSLVLAMFFFFEKRQLMPMLVFALLATAAKEDVPLVVGMAGLWVLVARRDVKFGAPLIVVGAVVAGFDLGWLIPHFSVTSTSPFVARYGYLGSSPLGIVLGLLRRPWLVMPQLTSPEVAAYVRLLLGSTGGLPLLAPFTVAIAAPSLGINMLSTFPWMRTGMAHYSALVLPVFGIATVEGMATAAWLIRKGWKQLSKFRPFGQLQPGSVAMALCHPLLAMWALAWAVGTHYEVGAGLGSYAFAPALPTAHEQMLNRFLAEIPPRAALSVTSAIAPHVTHRSRVYLFPNLLDASYVLLDLTAVPYPTSWGSQRLALLQLLQTNQFGVVDANDGYVLLERGAGQPNLPSRAFDFVHPPATTSNASATATFGQSLTLVRSQIVPTYVLGAGWNERLITDWRVDRTVFGNWQLIVLANGATAGSVPLYAGELPSLIWRPTSTWNVGEVVRVVTPDLAVAAPEGLVVAWQTSSAGSGASFAQCMSDSQGMCASVDTAKVASGRVDTGVERYGVASWPSSLSVLAENRVDDLTGR